MIDEAVTACTTYAQIGPGSKSNLGGEGEATFILNAPSRLNAFGLGRAQTAARAQIVQSIQLGRSGR